MGYASLRDCVDDLERQGQLVKLDVEVDPTLEAAEIQRRVYATGGPAIFFSHLKGCAFPAVSNLFGTTKRAQYIFRDELAGVRALVMGKADPTALLRSPSLVARAPFAAMHLLPRPTWRAPVLAHETTISALPPITSWPKDGGPFITLPQVYTEDPDRPGWRHSNLGMYRVQLSGNQYVRDHEVGLHYQIHRGIGVHHATAIRRGERLRVNVFVGGPPAHSLAAVMPLPEGLPELAFAGAMNGRAVRLGKLGDGPAIMADSDFCIRGSIDPSETKPEGPFGDHLGYYSLTHENPVMRVESVHHRTGAIWPFTVVGRPPQEDTMFGELIHEITAPLIPDVLPGVHAVHAVDAAGVHPLLLAIGSERYVPYAKTRRPMELLTQASAILGQGQMSLAKFLFIAANEDSPELDIHDVPAFFAHVLERLDPTRDLHFVCNTTMDTLDYSGTGLNAGSKVAIAAAGPKRRELSRTIPHDLRLPSECSDARVAMPGVLVVRAPAFDSPESAERFCAFYKDSDLGGFPLVVLVDDAEFAARTTNNFLWVTFTRSNPAIDVHGVGAFVQDKAWGCRGSVVIDARIKPHHAPPLVEDPEVVRRIEALAVKGGPLHGLI
jgi:4-hydroxy-3-polyprenylbenzoate decarboxylase